MSLSNQNIIKFKNDFINNIISSIKIQFLLNYRILIIILFLSFIYFSGYLEGSSQSLTAHDEGLYVGRAKLMLNSENWFTPFSTAHHKTVGSYWLTAISLKIFGFSELSARLPSGIFSIGCSVLVYFISNRFLSKNASLISSILLPSMPLWLQYSRYASPDIPFVFIILLIILCLIKYEENVLLKVNKADIYLFIIGILFSLAFLLRSFMVFLPLLGLSPYIYHLPNIKNWDQLKYIFLGIFVGLIPTILSVYMAYAHYGISALNSLYFFAKDKAIGGYSFKSLFFYPGNILILSFPTLLISIIGVKSVLTRRGNRCRLLLIIYPLIIIIILSIMPTRYSHYSLVLFPILSILFGEAFNTTLKLNNFSLNFYFKILGLIFLFISFIFFYLLFFAPDNNLVSSIHNIKSFSNKLLPLFVVYTLAGLSILLRIFSNYQIKYIILLLALVQLFTFSNLYSTGRMGNPNPEIKEFVNQVDVSNILKSESIMLIDIQGKDRTLMQCYIPKYKHLANSKQLGKLINYIIIKDSKLLDFKPSNFKQVTLIGNYKELVLAKVILNNI